MKGTTIFFDCGVGLIYHDKIMLISSRLLVSQRSITILGKLLQRVRRIKEELIHNIALDDSTNQKWAFGGMPNE